MPDLTQARAFARSIERGAAEIVAIIDQLPPAPVTDEVIAVFKEVDASIAALLVDARAELALLDLPGAGELADLVASLHTTTQSLAVRLAELEAKLGLPTPEEQI